jgi:transposase
MGKTTLGRWVKGVKKPHKLRLEARIASAVAAHLACKPFSTMSDVVQEIKRSQDIQISTSTAWRSARLARYTRKRAHPLWHPKVPTPADAESFLSSLRGGGEAIAIDETCVYVNESPRYGYGLLGHRVHHRKRKPGTKITLLLAISEVRGVIGYRAMRGSCNTKIFTEFVDTLDASKDATLIMDNVAFHHSKAVSEAAKHRGFRLLFTPPYSPDFNPIENAFSVLKNALRKQDTLALHVALRTITAPKCSAFFRQTVRFCEAMIVPLERDVPGAGGPDIPATSAGL